MTKVSRGIEPAQMAFSAESFGPGERQRGVCEHIRKELAEIDADPDDLNEWIDVLTPGTRRRPAPVHAPPRV